MRVLVACEESQTVCKAFRALGHEAYSCDIVPTRGAHTEWHIQDDVLKHLDEGWDMMIAHPPCTHLAVSGARWFPDKKEQQKAAIEFFMALVNASIPRICIENPVGIMSTRYRKPDQYIQPYEYGHTEQKKTCLWLKNLPKLRETNNVYDAMMKLPKRERERVWHMAPSESRGRERSITYLGWANAMATQWSIL